LLCAIVHAADIQDRDGGVLLMGALFGLFPFLMKLYADSGYQGPKFQRSSSAPTPASSSCCPNAGSSNEPLHGSRDVGAWPRTGSA
jgi:hypothetical protein